MKFSRIRLPKQTTNRLTNLKGKTGLNPNVLMRYGVLLSLKEISDPIYEDQACDGMELHRHVLLGDLDQIISALVIQRFSKTPQYPDPFTCFKAHLYRGVDILFAKVKGLGDLGVLVDNT
ncbi:DndE family protein [Desulfovibrio oxyclinae]|uniref:DndE family protein n=1 Tax=Desulfovibrio oxyclinae TaxID=63560 RepID=UPI0003826EEB